MAPAGARTVGALVAPGEAEALPLLRPHLHDRLLPAPDRAAADRLARAARCARATATGSTTSAA